MIDKSLRQYYRDGENVKKEKNILEKLASSFFKGKEFIATKKTELTAPTDTRNLMDITSDVILKKWGLTAQDIKNIKTGKPISKVASDILKRKFAIGGEGEGLSLSEGFKASPTNVFRAFNLARKTGIPVGKILSSPLLPIVGITGIAALANKYRKQITGYDTQREYEEAKELRVLEKRRADMLKRKSEGEGYSDRNLGQVTREIAKKKGLDINNPNEMRNIDKDIEDIKIEKEITGSGYGYPDSTKDIIKDPIIPQFPGENEIIQQQREKAEFDRVVAENKAKAEAEAAAQRAYAARVPDPIYHQPSGNGDRHGGGGGQTSQAAADRAGGSSYSSPFKKGGRIDKPLTGRSRDI